MKLFGDDSEKTADEEQGEPTEDVSSEHGKNDRGVPEVGRYHRDLIAPSGFSERASWAKVGEHYVKTFFINGWPDYGSNGFLEEVFLGTAVQNDISIHIDPYKSDVAVNQLEDEVKKSESLANSTTGGLISSLTTRKDARETRETYNALTETDANLFDVGMYLTVRTTDKSKLDRITDEVVRKLKSAPARTKPTVAKKSQLEALKAVSPINQDTVNYKTEFLGGGLAAMFPFSSTSLDEEGGVDFGVHDSNNSHVFVNRFARENGSNQFTVGKIGSGKSFSTKLNVLRTMASRDDVITYMIDPLGGFDNINDALQGKHIVIGGNNTVNPMDLRVSRNESAVKAGVDPYAMKKRNLMDFFDMFFAQRGEGMDGARGVLEQAIEKTYSDAGITRDPETHSRPSPNLKHLIAVLEEMVENPEAFAYAEAESHIEDIRSGASKLLISFQPFKKGGELENLAGESELDIRDENAVYFDLRQNEATGNSGLMMQVLFSEIYERAKSTDKKVMLVIDEAHYLTKDARSLDFLSQAVRHSRHYDLSINFITQTIDEFFSHEKAKTIVENCSIKLFQKLDTDIPDDIATTLGLNESEQQYIRNAQAGKQEAGFSQALLGVGSHGYIPIKVIASEFEETLITYDPSKDADPYGFGEFEKLLDSVEFDKSDFEPDESTAPAEEAH